MIRRIVLVGFQLFLPCASVFTFNFNFKCSCSLRVGLGQNGQILFISVEQLSLNVADDSAKTLSVLGNMGDVLDDCRLRFLQMCRRPPQNTPDFGVQRIFQNITEKGPLQESYQIDELRSQTLQSHASYTYLPSALETPP